MKIKITINNVQHIKKQEAIFDLSENKISCITGKNGIGKTTLIRAVRNLCINNTFQETAAPYIFDNNSSIVYSLDSLSNDIVFEYNRFIKSIDTKQEIPECIKSKVNVELPIPHGERFKHFQSLMAKDDELRSKIANGKYDIASDLILFLNKVYGDGRFLNLKKAEVKGAYYYFILRDEDERFYIREDYFSSGEYFVINLYKQIEQGRKLIVIDEIDISLDARAQVNLVKALREYCSDYDVNIVFTTHSLALMKTLQENELLYMEEEEGVVTIKPRSYNFVKSIMYGFSGFDKYILTEDQCLAKYIEYLISSHNSNVFFKYQIIYIGGANQVVDLMNRNAELKFLSENKNVLTVLDGDQKGKKYIENIENIILLPFLNIELQIYDKYLEGELIFEGLSAPDNKKKGDRAKSLYKQITKCSPVKKALMPEEKVYEYLLSLDEIGVKDFAGKIIRFLT